MVGCGSNPIKTENALSGSEILQLFSDKTYDLEKIRNGWQLKIYTARSGVAEVAFITGKRAGQTKTISWSVKDNKFCSHQKNGYTKCGLIVPQGKGIYYRLNLDNSIRAVASNFVSGNKLQ